mgnify:CR=1 FL=1|tara:strand:- start:59281 stop:60504 length:1224 start_codon:yes stop_codon:yes gene_type:complete
MKITRRTFVNLTSAAMVAAPYATSAKAQSSGDDPLGIRGDFPLLETTNFLNTAYHSVAPQQVVDAGVQFYLDRGNPADGIGPWIGEGRAVRAKFANMVGAKTSEIGLIHATSDAENIVANALDLKEGDNIVTDDLQYVASFVLYDHFAKTKGVEVRIVKRDESGASNYSEFEKLVDDKTRIVSVSWVSHENGFQHDLKSLSDLAHSHDAYLYVDAIQGVGMLELDVKETGIDFFGCGTYKWLLGSYGAAFFYIRDELQDIIPADRRGMLSVTNTEIMTDFDSYPDAAKYGYATPAFGAITVVGTALDYIASVGVGNIEKHTVPLAAQMREAIVENGLRTDTPRGNRSAIVTFFHGKDPATVKALFDSENIKATYKHGGTKIRVGASLFNNQSDIDHFKQVTGKLAAL